jgi:hypothetical protein
MVRPNQLRSAQLSSAQVRVDQFGPALDHQRKAERG